LKLLAGFLLFIFSFEQVSSAFPLQNFSSIQQDTSLPYLMEAAELFDPLGFVKETNEKVWNLSGSLTRTDQTFFNALGHETRIVNEQGDFSFTNYLDREGRLIRRTDQYGTADWFAVDVGREALSVKGEASSRDSRDTLHEIRFTIIENFLLLHGRLPTSEELAAEENFIQNKGRFLSRSRLSLSERFTLYASPFTPVGMLDSSLVPSYGITPTELSEISFRSSSLHASRSAASLEEEKLETKHLETLAQKIFRRLLGR